VPVRLTERALADNFDSHSHGGFDLFDEDSDPEFLGAAGLDQKRSGWNVVPRLICRMSTTGPATRRVCRANR
jgi:hypothetical protein